MSKSSVTWLIVPLVLVCARGMCEEAYSPIIANEYPTRVFWGDTHLHTALSGDAWNYGTRLGPEAAYRFAKGETVVSTTGQPARLRRPLDFLVVSDHANNLSAQYSRDKYRDESNFRDTPLGKAWVLAKEVVLRESGITEEALFEEYLATVHRDDGISVRHDGFRTLAWEAITSAADRHNEPGRFTAFNGYEWTPRRGAVHRVVVFRDDASYANQILPFSSFDSTNVEDLWEFFAAYEAKTGGSVLSIPHNSNLTSGLMFDLKDSFGDPLDLEYANTRARWEPLLEVTQIKGDSETHPFLSPDDEFADFETWNGWGGVEPNPNRPDDRIQHEYARSALKLGLDQYAEIGKNPFKFGMIGSTDSHTALSTAAEDNSFGKFARDEPKPDRFFSNWPGWESSASGYAAVWATENTREAIFDAMRRKETYATSGPRIALRFFGGWTFESGDELRADYAALGYASGVPMGGDLPSCADDCTPTFIVHAAKDPDGANLDRVQIVKGWRDASGELHERVFDVAWSSGRELLNGDLQAVGSTVDVEQATYTNSIGAAELATVWRDPEFDNSTHAFYYARVIEIPKPRWTAYDAKFYGLKDLDPNIPMVVQDRAYSSPIWFTAD